MKLYWTLKSIPELAPLSPPDRDRVWSACFLKSLRYWQTWIGMLLIPIWGSGPAWALRTLLVWNGMNASVAYLVTIPIFGVGFLLGIVVARHIIVAQIRPYLRAYLAQLPPAPRQDTDVH